LELALASAHAELMERLQNQLLYKQQIEMTWAYNQTRNVSDFIYCPDEVFLLPEEYIDSVDPSILKIFAPANRTETDPGEWLSLFTQNGRLICVPYLDLIEERTMLLPLNLVSYFYRSTGMCAGNSVHEALVQGLCEVVERHVIDIIYHDKIAPPAALTNGSSEVPVIKSLIDGIESDGRFKLEFKDLSLDVGFPAVASILLDREHGTYHVNIGVHPNLDEALARSLTENFQGRTFSDFALAPRFNVYNPGYDDTPGSYNFNSILTTGDGVYPNSFFFGRPDYPARLSIPEKKFSTREAFHYMKSLLHNYTQGPVLVRDVSFMGFPSYHVIVPGMSSGRYTLEMAQLGKEHTEVGTLLIDLDKRTESDWRRIRDYIETYTSNIPDVKVSLSDFSWIPFRNDSPWSQTESRLFLFALNLALGENSKAVDALTTFIKLIDGEKESGSRKQVKYFSAMRDLFGLMTKENLGQGKAFEWIEKFYGRETAQRVSRDLPDESKKFGDLKIPRCFRCDRCDLKNACDFPLWEDIYAYTRQRMSEANISQENLIKELK